MRISLLLAVLMVSGCASKARVCLELPEAANLQKASKKRGSKGGRKNTEMAAVVERAVKNHRTKRQKCKATALKKLHSPEGRIFIQIDYVDGFEPTKSARRALKRRLKAALGHTRITVKRGDKISKKKWNARKDGLGKWDDRPRRKKNIVRFLKNKELPPPKAGDDAYIYVISGPEYYKGSPLGYAYPACHLHRSVKYPVVVLFQEAIPPLGGASTLVHEVAHTLGLPGDGHSDKADFLTMRAKAKYPRKQVKQQAYVENSLKLCKKLRKAKRTARTKPKETLKGFPEHCNSQKKLQTKRCTNEKKKYLKDKKVLKAKVQGLKKKLKKTIGDSKDCPPVGLPHCTSSSCVLYRSPDVQSVIFQAVPLILNRPRLCRACQKTLKNKRKGKET